MFPRQGLDSYLRPGSKELCFATLSTYNLGVAIMTLEYSRMNFGKHFGSELV